MATVKLTEDLEETGMVFTVVIDMDCEHSEQAYEIDFCDNSSWVYGNELDLIIKTLQKAKRIHKTRLIKKGD